MLGVAPTYDSIAERDTSLADLIVNGPILPQSYRLVGPGSQEEAWQQYEQIYRKSMAGTSKEMNGEA